MQPPREIPIPGLFQVLHDLVDDELFARLAEAGYPELRPTHACVFGTIGKEGDRLTALADRAEMTKQAVGEVVTELESIGYVERVPDPSDGRAKIIRLTDRGRAAWELGWTIFDDIERRWAERHGAERVRDLLDLAAEVIEAERGAPAEVRPAA